VPLGTPNIPPYHALRSIAVGSGKNAYSPRSVDSDEAFSPQNYRRGSTIEDAGFVPPNYHGSRSVNVDDSFIPGNYRRTKNNAVEAVSVPVASQGNGDV
jgi:hypothetical protein